MARPFLSRGVRNCGGVFWAVGLVGGCQLKGLYRTAGRKVVSY